MQVPSDFEMKEDEDELSEEFMKVWVWTLDTEPCTPTRPDKPRFKPSCETRVCLRRG